jgi:hypothetical protein
MQQSGRGWLGWLIFIFLIFGSRFLPPVAAWLSQVTGLSIGPQHLIVAVIALSVVGSIIGPGLRRIARARSSGDARLPTTLPPPPTPPPATRSTPPSVNTGLPPSSGPTRLTPPRLPTGEYRLPGPPRFEPIIDPRILSWGILALLGFGAFFLVVLFLMGSTP